MLSDLAAVLATFYNLAAIVMSPEPMQLQLSKLQSTPRHATPFSGAPQRVVWGASGRKPLSNMARGIV